MTEVASGDLVLPVEGQVEGKSFLGGEERKKGGREGRRGKERVREREMMGRRGEKREKCCHK